MRSILLITVACAACSTMVPLARESDVPPPDVTPTGSDVDATTPDPPAPDVSTPDVPALDASASDIAISDASPDAVDVAPPCPAGDGRVGGVCVALVAPRLVAPLSMATATSRRPTLRWEAAPGVPGARVELCRDRACVAPIATMDVSRADSARPAADLAPGVYFWRVFGAAGDTPGLAPSATWSFVIGPRASAVDTSFGAFVDFNGDGYSDLALQRYTPFYARSNHVDLWAGSASGLPATSTGLVVAPVRSDYEGYLLADVNGDGYTDLVRGSASGNLLYAGADDGVASARMSAFPTIASTTSPTSRVPLGRCRTADVNRDGRLDLVCFVSPNVAVFTANAAGGYDAPTLRPLAEIAGSPYWQSSFLVSDVDGDGYHDAVVTSTYGSDRSATPGPYQYVSVLRGGPSGLSTPFTLPSAPTGAGLCAADLGHTTSYTTGGDFNGDGFGDVAVSHYPPLSSRVRGVCVQVYFGGLDGLVRARVTHLADERDTIQGLTPSDVNGDGFTDLLYVASLTDGSGQLGLITLRGSAAGVIDDRSATLRPPFAGWGFYGVYGLGDFNRDGFGDIVMNIRGGVDAGAPLDDFVLYAGSTTGLPMTPSRDLDYPWTPWM